MEETVKEKASIYEIGFLFTPTVADGALAGEFGTLKSKIEEIGGVSISEEFPQLMDLAYEMSLTIANRKVKFTQGYFGWIKFELEPSRINDLKVFADSNEKVIRSLIIKTVRDNTFIGKKFASKTDRKRTNVRNKSEDKLAEEKPAEEINEVELDKQIEELVTE